ncbi:MAG: hypothetical protein QFX33_02770 [Candidatus Nezhaarchaeota archaeon]|nr:hypothetical protein [Candidatus Nezhaarchaeota archaeon]
MGGRRKRKKVMKRVVHKAPKVFRCPNCDAISVTVSDEDEEVLVSCSNCNLSSRLEKVRNYEPVHYYNLFVDKYHSGEVQNKG